MAKGLTKCLVVMLMFVLLTISPSIQANNSVFGISEDLLRSFESQKAFEQYMAANNFQLTNKFPFLQYDLLPIPLDAGFSFLQTPTLGQVYSQSGTPKVLQETIRGKVLGKYSILPTEYIELVLYQNQAMQHNGLVTSQMQGQFGKYTIEAQSTVINGFKILYGYDAEQESEQAESVRGLTSTFLTQNAGVEFNVLPGMSLNADYKKFIKSKGLGEAYRHLSLAINPSSFASFNAGYGILSTASVLSDSTVFPTATNGDSATSLEDIVIKQLGLSLQPTNYSQFSANYTFVNERGEPITSSIAEFGFRLGNSRKELNATYQMESDYDQKTTTSAGFELGLVDLAKLSAVYSKTEDQQYTNSSTVDLGLNLNIAKNSSFHFQYKLFLPDDKPEEEQTAEAKLVFSF